MALQAGMLQPHEAALFNYLEKLVPHVVEEFETSYTEVGRMQDYAWMPAVCKYVDDPSYKNTWLDHGTQGPTPRRQELQSLPLGQLPDSVTAEVTQEFYGEQIVVSEDYLYYADRRIQLTTDLRKQLASWARTSLKREREQVFNLFANAFTTANGYQTWEGKALCADDHANQHNASGPTWDNLSDAPFSYSALEAMSQTSSFTVGPDGQGVTFAFDTIITGPALETTVRKVLESLKEPDNVNVNNVNLFRRGWRHVILPDLQDDILAGADDMWFLEDSFQHTLRLFYGKRPSIRLVRAENARDWAYMHEFDLVADWYSPYGFWGSTGDA